MRLTFLCLFASLLLSSASQAQAPSGVPVFVVTPENSSVKFFVKASVALEGNFEKWDATLTYPSTDVTTGVLDVKIQNADPPVASDAEAAVATASATNTAGAASAHSDWHFVVAPYLWFPGVHGTVGARGRDVSLHASPGDLLSHFRFGLMGLVDTRYKRVVLPVDFMWVRLADDKAIPAPGLQEVSANIKGSEFILAPKVGYRIIDTEKMKIDGLAGFRYWHFGESLSFTPSVMGLNFSASQNWVDPLVGGRIFGNLTPKIEVWIGGDVGGWGTGSQLDYQVFSALGYRIKPAVALQVGYRYLYVNYRNGGTTIDTVTSGALMGVTITLK